MTLIGITGILKQESGALNVSERTTPIGRLFTVMLGTIWLLTGIAFIAGFFASDALRDMLVGYGALIASGELLLAFVGALIILSTANRMARRRQAASEANFTLHFERLQMVVHPDYGRGR